MRILFTLILLIIPSASVLAQECNRIETAIPVHISSGSVENKAKTRATIYKEAIIFRDAASIRLQFGRVTLGNSPSAGQPTVLRITSYQDGAVQHLTSKTLDQWRYTSAWFNGSMVLVEIIADPESDPSHFELTHVLVDFISDDARSICGPWDDRVLSDDPKTGRVYPNGCTAWLIDDPNHCLLSAGHCTDGMDLMEFNVPLSNSNGSWQHPGPEDQYMVDPESLQYTYEAIGDDWAYFGCFPNTETDLTPAQAQGEWFTLADSAPPVAGQTIRITGYGTTSAPIDPSWNSAQKTHTGFYSYQGGSSIGYAVDTTGGNSGSAVLDETTGNAIGIHTNAGCQVSGGYNWGCAIHNAGLQEALAHPKGVCIPESPLHFDYPYGLPTSVTPNTATPLIFKITQATESPIPETVQCRIVINNAPQNLQVVVLGDDFYRVVLPSMECSSVVGFYISAATEEGSTVTDPTNAPKDLHPLVVGLLTETSYISVDFNNGLPLGWTTSGLPHVSTSCAPSGLCGGGSFVYFSQDSSCDYETGSTETGILTSTPVNIENATDLTISFCYSLITENYAGYDIAEVYANDVLIATLEDEDQWTEKEIILTNITGSSLTLQWVFDSVDDQYNEYRGLHIDNVSLIAHEITCETPSCVCDMNQDQVVDVTDLLMLIDDWGSTNGPGDFDGNGTTDISDLLILISAWGDCTL